MRVHLHHSPAITHKRWARAEERSTFYRPNYGQLVSHFHCKITVIIHYIYVNDIYNASIVIFEAVSKPCVIAYFYSVFFHPCLLESCKHILCKLSDSVFNLSNLLISPGSDSLDIYRRLCLLNVFNCPSIVLKEREVGYKMWRIMALTQEQAYISGNTEALLAIKANSDSIWEVLIWSRVH